MKKQTIITALMASTFAVSSQAANNNPCTIAYLQSEITKVMNYIQSQISDIPVVTTYTIGQQALGGTVFYVDSSGTHGLVAAQSLNGIASGQTWDGGISNSALDVITNATGNGIGAGFMNTLLMTSVQSSYIATFDSSLSSMAAQACVNFAVQEDGQTPCSATPNPDASCIAGWYLPSLYELQLMYFQRNVLNYPITPDQDAFLWSSTESDQNNAYSVNFTASEQSVSRSKTDSAGSWCIHEF